MIMKPKDNVGICLAEMPAKSTINVKIEGSTKKITLTDDIPFAHKFALIDIKAGGHIIKYGEVIGVASKSIRAGQWVHVHNIESIRARGDKK
jgi:altronate dehydratase small subunit